MTDNHPITPSPDLVQQWLGERYGRVVVPGEASIRVATQAARWGADQELEASLEWLVQEAYIDAPCRLRAARRPKPPSLKEQALAELEILRIDANTHGLGFDTPAIRRALEALPND